MRAITPPHIQTEMNRLRDLMPASGRMVITIAPVPPPAAAIASPPPYPWRRDRYTIPINFAQWLPLPQPQRDLLFLQAVMGRLRGQGMRVTAMQGVAGLSVAGLGLEWVQHNAVGVVVAGGLTAIALRQAWRDVHGPQRDLDADGAALEMAERRGYGRVEAAEALCAGIEAIAGPNLTVAELLRVRALRAIVTQNPYPGGMAQLK